jgi:hypothetical protein
MPNGEVSGKPLIAASTLHKKPIPLLTRNLVSKRSSKPIWNHDPEKTRASLDHNTVNGKYSCFPSILGALSHKHQFFVSWISRHFIRIRASGYLNHGSGNPLLASNLPHQVVFLKYVDCSDISRMILANTRVITVLVLSETMDSKVHCRGHLLASSENYRPKVLIPVYMTRVILAIPPRSRSYTKSSHVLVLSTTIDAEARGK